MIAFSPVMLIANPSLTYARFFLAGSLHTVKHVYVSISFSKTYPSPMSTSLFRTTDGTWGQRVTNPLGKPDSQTLIRGTGCLTL